jgi:hypothetical protein
VKALRKPLAVAVAIGLLGIVLATSGASLRYRKHLDIRVTLSHYNAKSQPVCLVTFSNVSNAVILCFGDFEIDFVTNGVWASMSYSEPGGVAGPFPPRQLSRKKVVLPTNTTFVRVKQGYEQVPSWVERIAAILGGEVSWRVAYAVFKKAKSVDCSGILTIAPPAGSTNSPPVKGLRIPD